MKIKSIRPRAYNLRGANNDDIAMAGSVCLLLFPIVVILFRDQIVAGMTAWLVGSAGVVTGLALWKRHVTRWAGSARHEAGRAKGARETESAPALAQEQEGQPADWPPTSYRPTKTIVGALVCAAGVIFTAVTYASAVSTGGGTYYVAYGAIIVGAYWLLTGLWERSD